MIEVCDIVEYGLDSFGKRPQKYRVTHHLKRVEDKLDEWKPEDIGGEITKEILVEEREKEIAKRKELGLPHTRRYKLVYCRPEEATHISLTGICGAQAAISECKKVRTVEWTPEHIARERANAVSDFWLKTQFYHDWEWE